MGAELKVRAVLTGRVFHRGDSLVVKTELVDVGDGSQIWGENYSRKFTDILALEEEISREISGKLRLEGHGRGGGTPDAPRDGEPGSVSALSQRTLLLEQADRRRAAQGNRALSAGDRARPRVRARIRRGRALLQSAGFLPAASAAGRIPAGQGGGDPRPGARAVARGGAGRSRRRSFLVRLGLAGRREGVPARDRIQPGLRSRAPLLRHLPDGHGEIRGGAGGAATGGGAGSALPARPGQPGSLPLSGTPIRRKRRRTREGDRDGLELRGRVSCLEPCLPRAAEVEPGDRVRDARRGAGGPRPVPPFGARGQPGRCRAKGRSGNDPHGARGPVAASVCLFGRDRFPRNRSGPDRTRPSTRSARLSPSEHGDSRCSRSTHARNRCARIRGSRSSCGESVSEGGGRLRARD